MALVSASKRCVLKRDNAGLRNFGSPYPSHPHLSPHPTLHRSIRTSVGSRQAIRSVSTTAPSSSLVVNAHVWCTAAGWGPKYMFRISGFTAGPGGQPIAQLTSLTDGSPADAPVALLMLVDGKRLLEST